MTIAYIGFPDHLLDYKWINHFADRYQVVVFADQHAAAYPMLSEKVQVCNVLPSSYPFKDVLLKWKTIRKLKRAIKENQVDIIHSLYAVPNAFWAYHIRFPKHIITTRGSDILVEYGKNFLSYHSFFDRIHKGYLKHIFEASFHNARFITSTSMNQQEGIKAFHRNPERLRLIRTGAEVNRFEKVRENHAAQKQSDPDTIRLFSPRIIDTNYNIDIMLNALVLLKQRHADKRFSLTLVDYYPNSDYSKGIKEKINDLGLADDCVILPAQTIEQMMINSLEADLILSIPKSDGTSNSMLEGMLAKKPVIIGNLPYDSDLFNDNTVWKIADFTSGALAQTVDQILNLPPAELAKKLDQAYQAVVEKANLSVSLQQIDQLYQQLVSQKSDL